MLNRHRFEVVANLVGPGRTEELHGTTYRVVDATLVRSQVLVNNVGRCYLPPDAITDQWAEMANATPVVTDHPTDRGVEVSARTPGILNSIGIGWLFDARVEDGELVGEVWLNEGRAEDVDDLAVILENLEDGEDVELSTGFPAFGERRKGVVNGEEYDVVVYPDGYDHTAVFAEKTGACSVEDGCGLHANEDGEGEGGEPDPSGEEDPDGDGEPVPDVRNVDAADRWWRRLFTELHERLVGNQEDEISLDDRRRMVREAADAEFGGEDTFTWVEELFETDAVIGVDPQGEESTFLRADYEIDEEERTATLGEPEEVEKVTEFVSVNGVIQARHEFLATQPTQEDEMNREQMIQRLCDCEDVPFDRERLEEMSDAELAFAANAAGLAGNEAEEDGGAEGGDGAEPAATAEPSSEDGEEEAPAWAKPLLDTVQGLRKDVDQLQEETSPVRHQARKERTKLVGEITANSDFEESDLEDRSLDELRKIHALAERKGRNYVGLGLPSSDRGREESGEDLGFAVHSTMGAGPGEPMDADEAN